MKMYILYILFKYVYICMYSDPIQPLLPHSNSSLTSYHFHILSFKNH